MGGCAVRVSTELVLGKRRPHQELVYFRATNGLGEKVIQQAKRSLVYVGLDATEHRL